MRGEEGESMLRIYIPTGEDEAFQKSLAPRVPGLDGKVIGILDNGKWNANKLLRAIEQQMRGKYALPAVLSRKKEGPSVPAPLGMIAELAEQCDLVITAIGD